MRELLSNNMQPKRRQADITSHTSTKTTAIWDSVAPRYTLQDASSPLFITIRLVDVMSWLWLLVLM